MKAIYVKKFGEPDVLEIADVEKPEPSQDDILVKIEAIGVNPVDTYVRAGQYPVLPTLPFIPGKDVSGVVVEVGANVKKWKEGDRVYSSGTLTGAYAEYTVCHQSQIFSLPDSISFKQGAAVGVPGAAAWRALFTRARARKGESLLVHGASGSVGLIAVSLAVAEGLTVHGTASSDEGIVKVRRAGAGKVYNHSDPGYLEEMSRDLGEAGYDIILEMLANVNLANDLIMLGKGGRVVIIGSRGEVSIDPRATMAKETEIMGMSLFNSSDEEMNEAQMGLYTEMAAGRLVPEISRDYPLERADEAHKQVLKSGNCGKIILLP